MLALIRPVTTSTDGLCVATTRWIPTARAICAIRHIADSTSRGATIIRSESSSTMTRMYGSGYGSGSSSLRLMTAEELEDRQADDDDAA